MLAGVGRGGDVVAHGRADATHLVRCHAAPDPGAVDHDAEARPSAGHLVRHGHGEIRIVHGLASIRAEIRRFVPQLDEPLRDDCLERHPAVVGAERDSTGRGERGFVGWSRLIPLVCRLFPHPAPRIALESNPRLPGRIRRRRRDHGAGDVERGRAGARGASDVALGDRAAARHVN